MNALELVFAFAVGFALGVILGVADYRKRSNPSRGKRLRMDVSEEKTNHE